MFWKTIANLHDFYSLFLWIFAVVALKTICLLHSKKKYISSSFISFAFLAVIRHEPEQVPIMRGMREHALI